MSKAKRVLIATAEPWGSYHLVELLAETPNHIIAEHLTPDEDDRSVDVSRLKDADLVVVCGGELVEWTTSVARSATALRIPCVYLEVAYLPPGGLTLPDGIRFVSTLFALPGSIGSIDDDDSWGEVLVVGLLGLDLLPSWTPTPNRLVALTTVSSESPDNGLWLQRVCSHMSDAAWEVLVRCHPREEQDRWVFHVVDRSPTMADALRYASVVVGVPGTAFLTAAAMGVPAIGLGMQPWMTDRVPEPVRQVMQVAASVDEVWQMATDSTPLSPNTRATVLGEVGGTAKRIWAHIDKVMNS